MLEYLDVAFLFLLLGGMVYLFLTEKLPVDLTAFLGLVVLVFGGYVTPQHAFDGFSSPAVITMLAIFILSAALLRTGVADVVGGWVHRLVGSNETSLIVVLMLVAGVLSAFMNNIAATAVLMPAVASIARRAGLSPSRLFMPLAFGAILGGTTTLVGTPPNLLGAAAMEKAGAKPFELFDFTALGAILLGVGVIYMVTVGRRLLPVVERAPREGTPRDLAEVYQLHDRLFSIRLSSDSQLAGRTLGESRLGTTLGVEVVGILRAGRRRLAPRAETRLVAGDVLLVDGSQEDLQHLVKVRDVEVSTTKAGDLPRPRAGVSGIRATLAAGSVFAGKSLRDLRFRERFGVVVVAVDRDGELFEEELGSLVLQEGDALLALGTSEDLEQLSRSDEFEVAKVGLSAVQQLQDALFLIRIPEESALVGTTVAESRLGELTGVTIAGLIRGGETRLGLAPDESLRAGDRLLVAGEPSRIVRLLEIGEVEFDGDIGKPNLESEEVGVVEATLAPRSGVAGQTLAELGFRNRYGLQVLAVWRDGAPHHRTLDRWRLEMGDALLLQGSRVKIRELADDADFVVLSQEAQAERRTHKAFYALGGLALMVVLVVTGLQPIHVAAFTAASLVLLSGAIRMEEAYRAIEWRALFLVAAVLPAGDAMTSCGADRILADGVLACADTLGPYGVLAALIALTSLLSQGLDGAPAVVLVAPVAIQIADRLGVSYAPMMMAVSLAASAAFMTPFSHKANLLVMGAGGYRAWDYVKVGTPLTIVVLLILTFVVPMVFPF